MFSYNTTIGLTQFHEQVLNRFIPTVTTGRPPKERTGKRGWPPKAKTSKKAVQAAIVKNRGRNFRNWKGKGSKWNKDVKVDIQAR